MARCEDFPCCGHEQGCCPSYDRNTGKQLDMKCVCGASVPLTSASSLCTACLRAPGVDGFDCDDEFDDFDGEDA